MHNQITTQNYMVLPGAPYWFIITITILDYGVHRSRSIHFGDTHKKKNFFLSLRDQFGPNTSLVKAQVTTWWKLM